MKVHENSLCVTQELFNDGAFDVFESIALGEGFNPNMLNKEIIKDVHNENSIFAGKLLRCTGCKEIVNQNEPHIRISLESFTNDGDSFDIKEVAIFCCKDCLLDSISSGEQSLQEAAYVAFS